MSEYRPTAAALEKELKRMKRTRRRHRSIAGYFIAALIALAIGVTIDRQCSVDIVRGSGMNNTLVASDIVLTIKRQPIARGDIVLISRDGQYLIRRVVARGGDRLEIQSSGQILLNGEPVKESYVLGETTPGRQLYPLTIPQGALFVMGDNRAESLDSRSTDFGLVAEDEVVGKPVAVIWPFYHFARLNG